MDVARTGRERVAIGFFSMVTLSVALMTGYHLLAGGGKKSEAAHQEEQPAALAKRASALEASVQANPQDVRALISLGDTYLELRDGARALPVFERAERIAPGDAHVQTDLGTLYQEMGRHDAALEKFNKALTLDPKHASVLLNIAAIHQQQGNRDKARGAIQALLAGNPDPQLANSARRVLAQIEAAHGSE